MPPTANELKEATKHERKPATGLHPRLADLMENDPPQDGESIYEIDAGLVVIPGFVRAKSVNEAARIVVNPVRLTQKRMIEVLKQEATGERD